MRIPKVCKHRASGQFVVRIAGKDHYLGRERAAAEAAYQPLVARWLAEGRPADFARPRTRTLLLAEAVAAYLDHAKATYLPPSREYADQRAAVMRLEPWFGEEVASFGPRHLDGLRQSWVEKGWSRRYANATVGRLLRFFRWLVSREMLAAERLMALKSLPPLRAGQTQAMEIDPRAAVSVGDFEAVLPHVTAPLRAALQIMWLTGARPSEVLAMRTGDIERAGAAWTYRPRSHKNAWRGQRREIPLGPQAREVLKPWLSADPDRFLFRPIDGAEDALARRRKREPKPAKPGGRRRPGERYSVDRLAKAVREACERAKVSAWTPYMIRHAVASELAREDGLDAARVVLGKKSLADTMRYGGHADLDRAAAIAERRG